MSYLYFKKSEIEENFQQHRWESVMFKEFEAMLTSKTRPFPCVFGVAGFQLNQLRFGFSDRMIASDIAPTLDHFVHHSREYGKNTSLVVFSNPKSVEDITRYEERFWSLLSNLASIDNYNWPEHIPCTINNPMWEFCFAGEPIFVVCNTPAHVMRQSRRSSSFMLTFQPRWVFEGILGVSELAKKSSDKVRARLKPFDLIPPSPHLGLYGDSKNREFSQYFLRENNNQVTCPYHQLPNQHFKKEYIVMSNTTNSDVRIKSSLVNPNNLFEIINVCLPKQGAIEVQHDQKGKEHSWHTHDTDETIIVIDGMLQFYWENRTEVCRAGDVIELPKGIKHRSIAINGDAKYINLRAH